MSKSKPTHRAETFTRPDQLFDKRRRQQVVRGLEISVLALLILFIGFPIYYLFGNAFQHVSSLYTPTLWPTTFTLGNFHNLFNQTNILKYLKNSLIVAAGSTLLTITITTLGGYGLARSSFRGQRNMARSVLFTYMFPPILLGIPLYILFAYFNQLNSYVALMLAHSARAVPFGLWLMWQYFQSMPIAYEEAAWINGASRLRTLRSVVFPMARPGIIAVTIFTFAVSWNDFTFASIMMTNSKMHTLPVALDLMISQQSVDWGVVLAAGVVVIAPALLLVIFVQDYLLQGFQLGQ